MFVKKLESEYKIADSYSDNLWKKADFGFEIGLPSFVSHHVVFFCISNLCEFFQPETDKVKVCMSNTLIF